MGRRQGSPAEDFPRGGEGRSSQFHRDEDRRHRECPSVEDDAGAPIERRSGAGDPPLRSGDHQDALKREPGLLFRFRDLSGRRSPRGGADRLPQSLKNPTTPGEKKVRGPKTKSSGLGKNPESSKKISLARNFFSETRNNY